MSTAGRRDAAPVPNESPPYAPVSGLAVGALLLATVTTTVIAALWVGARVSGRPSSEPLLLVAAVAAFALAVAARWQIRSSEGARGGLGLANAAWWLAALGGGSYAAYLVATELAIRQQAQKFTSEWFDKVSTGTVEAAFLDSLDAGARETIDATDVAGIRARFAKDLHGFRNCDMVRLLNRAGGKYEVTPRGLQGWEMVDNGFMVRQLYEVRTPEGKFLWLVPVFGRDSAELGGRTWRLAFQRYQTLQQRFTLLGTLLGEFLFEQRRFLQAWTEKINKQDLFGAYLETLPAAERTRIKSPNEAAGLAAFTEGSLIKVDGKPPAEDKRRQFATELFRPYAINFSLGDQQNPVGPPGLTVGASEVRADNLGEISFTEGVARPVVSEFAVVLEPGSLLDEIMRLRAADWRGFELMDPAKFDGTPEVARYADRRYRVVEVNIRPNAAPISGPPGSQRPA